VKLKWDGYYKELGSSARAFMFTGCSPFTRFTKFKANIFVQKTMAVLHVVFLFLFFSSLTYEVASGDWKVNNNEQEWTWKKSGCGVVQIVVLLFSWSYDENYAEYQDSRCPILHSNQTARTYKTEALSFELSCSVYPLKTVLFAATAVCTSNLATLS
jgi:hypothetical protein